ncbi:primosomal protein DnaI [Bacillus salacetis]|uniref:Primosomal protein DnaI n=1 Tax=Bacillus salacetis TaxID=2315464 RepID=A0A3A1QRC1_9BACI|nr:primosomal protein DnaI [Bacillus salacetis]RIW29728.1 primosomal protein DnaI [Bacillus salacetis]
MEPINHTLKKLAGSQAFKERYEKMRREILQDDYVKHFLEHNQGNVTRTMIDNSMVKLYEYISQSKQCVDCPSLGQCRNMMKGYDPHLVIRGSLIDIEYHICPRKEMDDEKRRSEKLIKSLYVPKDILLASFSNIDLDSPGRLEAVDLANEFVENYEAGKAQKGLYLHGKFGVGKSYLLGAIANQLAENKVSSLLVYMPEFVREMKQSLSDHSMDEKLDAVKKAPVLMLDDIGAETMSSWVRDEILGTILQFRMLENLPTFFTSNFDYDGLKHHLTYSQRGEEEKMKAARIMERIKYLTKPVLLDGTNRRE